MKLDVSKRTAYNSAFGASGGIFLLLKFLLKSKIIVQMKFVNIIRHRRKCAGRYSLTPA
ncbi:MAG: hypothetical protein ACKPB3_05450 [Bacteroidota bacterium]